MKNPSKAYQVNLFWHVRAPLWFRVEADAHAVHMSFPYQKLSEIRIHNNYLSLSRLNSQCNFYGFPMVHINTLFEYDSCLKN